MAEIDDVVLRRLVEIAGRNEEDPAIDAARELLNRQSGKSESFNEVVANAAEDVVRRALHQHTNVKATSRAARIVVEDLEAAGLLRVAQPAQEALYEVDMKNGEALLLMERERDGLRDALKHANHMQRLTADRADNAEASLIAIASVLGLTKESRSPGRGSLHARHNLDAARHDLARPGKALSDYDVVSIRTIDCVCNQLAKVEHHLEAAGISDT